MYDGGLVAEQQPSAVGGTVFGIPTLYAYLFAAWALLIALAVLIVERQT